ncbi:redox-sensing transcriptional repressor Rex [Anaerocolumna sp. AGMB13025]|uniref:redox-sensing transcriptional repressor Rex n=1 Tax=Anaerocolumna sp. AGMB13025 TaxID=3039116 RepID=UPI00241FEA0F|nr:redox-sensing transcriptional repressor Rex [Anaerocolumna sp. AGMB13025]WFR59269.1 redox-sensing transcriptional repressor Rex [Anaerocolumna sp. AGMB13025]
MIYKSISAQTLKRLPVYLDLLNSLPADKFTFISATTIAEALRLNDVQVRKDLALISSGGRPKIGYQTKNLIYDIEKFLGYDNVDSAVLAGAGSLGRALLSYDGFSKYGLDIVAAFDVDETIIDTTINGKQVLSSDKLNTLCSRMKVRIGIITVPAPYAQEICDQMVKSGILAIWNFTTVTLKVPDTILVQNEDIAFSLAKLSKNLSNRLNIL